MYNDIAKNQEMTLKEWRTSINSGKDFANSVAELDKVRDKKYVNWPVEDYVTITRRLFEGINEIAEKEIKKGGCNVLLISHDLSICALIDMFFKNFQIPSGGIKNASITNIKYKDGEFTIEKISDLSYVRAGQKEIEINPIIK